MRDGTHLLHMAVFALLILPEHGHRVNHTSPSGQSPAPGATVVELCGELVGDGKNTERRSLATVGVCLI